MTEPLTDEELRRWLSCEDPNERIATPDEVDEGCELGIWFSDCGKCHNCRVIATIDALTAELADEQNMRAELKGHYYSVVEQRDALTAEVHGQRTRAENAEAERDALLPIKESWSQLKKDLDEARAERNVAQQLAGSFVDECDRYREALKQIVSISAAPSIVNIVIAALTEPEKT